MKILLIDDNHTTNFIHKKIILNKLPNANIEIANTGEEALEILSKDPIFDILLLDLNMPIMNGFEFLDAYFLGVRSRGRASNIKIVILTTSINNLDKNRVKDYEGVMFMNKPLTTEKLNTLLNA